MHQYIASHLCLTARCIPPHWVIKLQPPAFCKTSQQTPQPKFEFGVWPIPPLEADDSKKTQPNRTVGRRHKQESSQTEGASPQKETTQSRRFMNLNSSSVEVLPTSKTSESQLWLSGRKAGQERGLHIRRVADRVTTREQPLSLLRETCSRCSPHTTERVKTRKRIFFGGFCRHEILAFQCQKMRTPPFWNWNVAQSPG